ncbi:DUF488 domain-containing protein [Marivirga sp.]|uniref:DUF488 domain-containing protein n=1 Tax=Marivirga sp. TaxID=2018662 RepID=UPI002D7E270D|nr:DUF488 domain-containing protein [Marivirga sp.]HET8860750.1 DUF488 domain-containing protein [Marivirga sp.]
MKRILTKRIYEQASDQDGYRMLIDKVWPRGVKKEDAKLDEWNKDIAPSTDLRKWFSHKAERFDEFARKYRQELEKKEETVQHITDIAEKHQVTLLYGAKDEKHNHAVILQEYLKNK